MSGGIACCAVPLFFLFSAYLLCKKGDALSVTLAKKSRSLLLPYAAWLAVYTVWFGPVRMLAANLVPSLFAKPEWNVFSQTAREWLAYAVGFCPEIADSYPRFAAQFWFVRDLMILTLLSPLLVRAVKQFPFAAISLATVFYVLGNVPVDGNAPSALFFFVAGIFWAESGFRLFSWIDRIKWSESLLIFVLALVLYYLVPNSLERSGFFSAVLTVSSCVLVLKCSKIIEGNSRAFSLAQRLSKYSFFLYAIHMPALLVTVQKAWIHFLPMKNTFFSLAEYICVSALVVLIGTGIGAALRKVCPPLFSLFNGERR